MPTYEYVCSECGHRFEEFHQMNDDSDGRCPECGEKAERKIGTGSGIIFKGSGFYATDYAKKKPGSGKGCCPNGGCCHED